MEAAVRSLALKQTAPTQRYLCPSCSSERRNKHDRCLSVTVEGNRAVFHCHHCSWSGAVPLTERPQYTPTLTIVPKRETVVIPSPQEDELETAYNWLASRGITRQTAANAGVIGGVKFLDGENRPAVGFAYNNGTHTYAVKWRSVVGKAFTQTGAAHTLYLAHQITKGSPLAITEGEVDCLSLRQVGVNAVSVPNGAISPLAKGGNGQPSRYEGKLAGVAEAKELIEAANKVIIAVDADDPGHALGEELARRIGRARCWLALWPDGCKDANDVLRLHGGEVLRECIENAQPWPVKGLYGVSDFMGKVRALYDKGLARGKRTGFQCVDELYTVVPGQLTIVTGAPGSGKSTFIDNIMVNLAKTEHWRFAVCSFENPPEVHIAKLAAIAGRQPFFDGPTPRMDKARSERALAWVGDHFSFLHQVDGSLSSLDDIIDLAKAAIMRYGIRGLVIDPYNFLDRGDSNETDWVSEALTKLKVLAMAHDIHIWLCAHPTKLRRKEDGTFPVPTGYDIAGSAHFFNKADMGVTIHRPDLLENKTEFHSWKVRFSFTGKVGKTNLTYDVATGLYFEKVTGEEED